MRESKVVDWVKAVKLYKEGYGTSYIGQQFEVPSNTIRRGLIKRQVPLRSKAEAQKLALESGRVSHPTQGKTHSVKTKAKIAKKSHDAWENMSEEKREEVKARSKDNWENRTDLQKQNMATKAAVGIRKASQEGSQLEKFLLSKIRSEGYEVNWHMSKVLENENLEVDLMLPSLRIAIEVDGPFHSQVVYSQEQLSKTIHADKTKNGLLLNAGYCVIRINSSKKNTSNYLFEQLWLKLKEVIKDIIKNFPKREDRLLQLEV